MNIISGSICYDKGQYLFNNHLVNTYTDNNWDNHRKNLVSMVFQNFRLIDELSVYDNIALPVRLSLNDEVIIKEKVKSVLSTVGLTDYDDRFPKELSGGEQQRVAIARAIIRENSIILADEPTGNLDSKTSKEILELLKKISTKRLVIMVTHDEETASLYANRRIQMQDGKVINDEILIDSEMNNIQSKEILNKTNSLFYKHAVRIAFSNFKTKMFRFFVSYILVALVFVLSLYALIGLTFEKEPILKEFIQDEPLNFISIKQENCLPMAIRSNQCRMNSEGKFLYQTIKNKSLNILFMQSNIQTLVNNNLENITMYEVFDEKQYDSFDLVYGNLPNSDNKILITDFLYNEIYGLTDFNSNDLPTVTVFGDEYFVSGIIETDYINQNHYNNFINNNLSLIEYHYFMNNYGYMIKSRQVFVNDFISLRFSNIFYEERQRLDDYNNVNIGKYKSGEIKILYGREIEKPNEIIVSSRFFANYKLEEHFADLENNVYSEEDILTILNEPYDFLDLYDEKYGLYYHQYINLRDYIGEVEIVGIYSPYQATDFIVDESLFNDIAYEQAMYYGFSSYALNLNHDNLDYTLTTLDENNIYIEHMHLPILYQVEHTLSNIRDIIAFITIVLFSVLVLFIYLYISMSIDLRKDQIKTLRLLGCTKKQITQIFYFEHIIGAVLMIITGTLFYLISLIIVNNRFQLMVNEYEIYYPYRILHFNSVLLIICFLVVFIATILSSYVTSRQYAQIYDAKVLSRK